ncbi:MAG: sigma-70 family RNA polymerase sigma factor [Chthonomonas sp.]|nr:sigma-70 family RNA polymerase sigma factor [Chthonomonas sp.]
MSEQSSNVQDREGLVLRYIANPRADLKDMIMVQYSGLVERIARRFSGLEQQDDLMQVGFIGLLNALSKFDPSTGVRFNTYATHLVAGEIKHYLRDRTQTIRQPAWLQELRHRVNKAVNLLQAQLGRQPSMDEIANELGISAVAVEEVFQTQEMLKLASLDQSASGEEEGTSEIDNLDASDFSSTQLAVEDRVVLERAITQLRDLEREVLVLFHFESMNQTEIAHRLGISCNYVSHILRQSLGKLRRILTNEEASDRVLKRQADTLEDTVVDNLTGVYNEDYFRSRVGEELHRASHSGSPLAVVGIRFEGIRDLKTYYGEACVRDFLVDAAEQLKECVRRLDVVCRFGPLGFAVILPSTNVSTEVVVQRLIRKFEDWLENRRAPSGPITIDATTVVAPMQAGSLEEIIAAIRKEEVEEAPVLTLSVGEATGKRKRKAA